MAETWSSLGYDRRAQEQAARAVELAKGLSREDRLLVEGRYHEMAQHWTEAIDRYRTLFGFFPDNVDYGISLAETLTRAGRPAEALATVALLRNLPAPASDDVRIDLAEADAAHESSDFERELTAGRSAADRGLRQGARLLVAQGRLAQAQAELRLGRPAEASRLVDSARQLFVAGGDRNGEARALNRIANIEYEQGDYDEAKRVFREAEKVLRTVGNLRDLATALNNVADTMMMQDDLASAAPVFAEALDLTRERGDLAFEGFLLLNLGDLAYRKGDLVAAESMGTKGLELARASARPYSIYMGLLALGNVALAKDDRAGATMRFDEGLTLARRAGDRRYTGYMLTGLGDVAVADGRIADARRHHQEALEHPLGARQRCGSRGKPPRARPHRGQRRTRTGERGRGCERHAGAQSPSPSGERVLRLERGGGGIGVRRAACRITSGRRNRATAFAIRSDREPSPLDRYPSGARGRIARRARPRGSRASRDCRRSETARLCMARARKPTRARRDSGCIAATRERRSLVGLEDSGPLALDSAPRAWGSVLQASGSDLGFRVRSFGLRIRSFGLRIRSLGPPPGVGRVKHSSIVPLSHHTTPSETARDVNITGQLNRLRVSAAALSRTGSGRHATVTSRLPAWTMAPRASSASRCAAPSCVV